MKYASDFRGIARNALAGRWKTAVVTGAIASLLGAVASNGSEINFNFELGGSNFSLDLAGQQIYTTELGWQPLLPGISAGTLHGIVAVALVFAAAYFVLGSIIVLGYGRFNLDLVGRQKEPEIGTLFGYFTYWKTAAASKFLQWLYVFLWSLLFIIPGIVAGYSYAMTGYILAENPELIASEALARSKQMMQGNRFRLFCLQLSFIGWDFLCVLTFGIGYLWLSPYKQAATAAFYREVSASELR